MSDSPEDRIEQVERDRRKRERELLLLLLFLMDETRQHVQAAIRLGHDPTLAAYNVIYGNPHIDQPGAVDEITGILSKSFDDGASRVAQWAEVEIPEKQYAAGVHYRDLIQLTVDSLYQRAADKIRETQALNASIAKQIQAIREAIDAAGLSRKNPSMLDLMSEQLVVTSYNGGMFAGYMAPIVHAKLWGFQHWSVLDRGTTEICRERNFLTLRKDNEYWLHNWVQLHMRCRSIIAPRFTDQTNVESPTLPSTPPDPGFGLAPAWVRALVAA